MDENLINLARLHLLEANEIVITSHKRPDGDAIGSVVGLGTALMEAGKEVQMILEDGVPSCFNHLVGSDRIKKSVKGSFDLSIVLDCSDLQRVGSVFEDSFVPTINIDHHVTNINFAEINIVKTKTPATAEILTQFIPRVGLSISKPTANALLTGIITDTLGFRTSNVHPETLRIVADLMEMGCDLPNLYEKALLNRSYKAARYWGAGLSTLQLENRLLWATLTQDDRKAIGYPGRDDADLINVLTSINDVDIALVFVEQPSGSVKVSWRSHKGFDVSRIALSFGGGGHKPAAGAEIQGDLEIVMADVLEATRRYLITNNNFV